MYDDLIKIVCVVFIHSIQREREGERVSQKESDGALLLLLIIF